MVLDYCLYKYTEVQILNASGADTSMQLDPGDLPVTFPSAQRFQDLLNAQAIEFLLRRHVMKSPEEHLAELKKTLPSNFQSLSDEDLLSFFPITRKPPKTSRVGDKYQATVIPDVKSPYEISDPARVGKEIVLSPVPSDIEKLRSERDAQRQKADKEDEKQDDEEGFALQSLYDMNFDEDDDSDDEEFATDPSDIVHVIDKKLDWLPGDPEDTARDIVLVLYGSGERAWKYPKEIEEFSHLIQVFDEEHGLKEEEAYDIDGDMQREENMSDVDVEALKLETEAVMKEMDEPPPAIPETDTESTITETSKKTTSSHNTTPEVPAKTISLPESPPAQPKETIEAQSEENLKAPPIEPVQVPVDI